MYTAWSHDDGGAGAHDQRPRSGPKLPPMEKDRRVFSAFDAASPAHAAMPAPAASAGAERSLGPMNEQLFAHARQAMAMDERVRQLEAKMGAAERMVRAAVWAHGVGVAWARRSAWCGRRREVRVGGGRTRGLFLLGLGGEVHVHGAGATGRVV
eukprot:359935-Chlamydomonas_euryale.AAC.8